jgi:hypothetical protein
MVPIMRLYEICFSLGKTLEYRRDSGVFGFLKNYGVCIMKKNFGGH